MKIEFKKYFQKGFFQGFGMTTAIMATAVLGVTITGVINTFAPGEILTSAKLNENFTSLKTAIESVKVPHVVDGSGNSVGVIIGSTITSSVYNILSQQGYTASIFFSNNSHQVYNTVPLVSTDAGCSTLYLSNMSNTVIHIGGTLNTLYMCGASTSVNYVSSYDTSSNTCSASSGTTSGCLIVPNDPAVTGIQSAYTGPLRTELR